MWHLGTWGSSGGTVGLDGLRDFPACNSTEVSPIVRKALSPERILEKSHQESCLGLFFSCLWDKNDSRNLWIVAFPAQFLAEGAQDSWVQTVALRDPNWAVSPTLCCSGGHSLVLEVFSSLNQPVILWNIKSSSEFPRCSNSGKIQLPCLLISDECLPWKSLRVFTLLQLEHCRPVDFLPTPSCCGHSQVQISVCSPISTLPACFDVCTFEYLSKPWKRFFWQTENVLHYLCAGNDIKHTFPVQWENVPCYQYLQGNWEFNFQSSP